MWVLQFRDFYPGDLVDTPGIYDSWELDETAYPSEEAAIEMGRKLGLQGVQGLINGRGNTDWNDVADFQPDDVYEKYGSSDVVFQRLCRIQAAKPEVFSPEDAEFLLAVFDPFMVTELKEYSC